MASNISAGTRGLSAGEWTRIQRLRGATTYVSVNLATNEDIAPPGNPQLGYSQAMLISKVVGTSKIRRPASSWTDFMASQKLTYITRAENPTNPNAKSLTLNTLCSCTTTPITVKTTGCTKCGVFTHKTIQ
uniref:Uncharacterized protein n=1 Tax=viral metagenome TaxID=1070528 RepID=A0A6C0AII4_9ZZZZ